MLDQNLTIIYDLSKSFKMNSRPIRISMDPCGISKIRVITKLPNSEQSYKGNVKTHKYINRQNQSTTGKL
jgi:hypothetical protein